MEASTRDRLRPAHGLVRKVLLPPLLAGTALLCLLLAVAISLGPQRTKADNPLARPSSTPDATAQQLSAHVEGVPTPADIRRAQKPLSERRRLLHAHPYYSLYTIAKQRFGVSSYLVAAVHYQETGFGEARNTLAKKGHWLRHRDATENILRPTNYPNRTKRHPSVKDDFDVVMAIAASLEAHGARNLGDDASKALAARYGSAATGRLATAMVIERARAWRLLGTLPLPGGGELATPTKGVVGGCGYFGCPRPGHLHNGVDFLAPTGTPIHAADGGVVASVESPGESGGYGNFVCIQHRPHLATCYAHMSAFAAAVRAGARVKRGQVIGLVGSTGSSSAPHLHFEVRRGAAACSACSVDPLPMLSGDVPDRALPQLAASAAVVTAAASSSGPDDAPAPEPPAAVIQSQSDGANPEQEDGAAVPRERNRSTAGGSPTAPTPPRSTPTAPAPAATPPAAQEPPRPPAAPATAPATGGAVPAISPPPPSPPSESAGPTNPPG